MKNVIISLLVFAGLTFLPTINARGEEPQKKDQQVIQNIRPGYTDKNNDGVCDFYDGTRPGQGRGPGNGKGLGRINGKRLGRGMGLRDGSGNGLRRMDGTGPNCYRR
ncbi:MAG: hypothetical protein GX820_08945 [Bacteroidales bacterium]|jgi:hypothetical protein|nr:hypothetical protein [Bacteroidales bacterium]